MPTFIPTGQVGLIWKVNETTGEILVCVMGGNLMDYVMKEPPKCSPSSGETTDEEVIE